MAETLIDQVERLRRQPPPWLVPVMAVDVVLRAFAARRAVQNGQRGWALAIGLINSMGILPVAYLIFFQREHPDDSADGA
jgi:hypothetical protein